MMTGEGENDRNQNSECKTCGEEECFVKNAKGSSQKVTTKLIACDLCKEWHHGMCQGLSTNELTSLSKMDGKGVKWFCSTCITEINTAIAGGNDLAGLKSLAENSTANQRLKNIEDMMTQMTTTVTSSHTAVSERIDQLEKSYAAAVKSNTEGVQRSIEINSSAKHLLAKNIEQNQAETRKYNAILYGIKADADKGALEQITDMLKTECFTHTKKPVKAVRLQSTAEPKPIKVEFSDENMKWEFLKRVNATQRENNIFCKLDESKEVRERQYELRQLIKQKKQSDTGSNIEYRIRNLKIQCKDGSGEWKSTNIIAQTRASRQSQL